jgi:hypothetical protein
MIYIYCKRDIYILYEQYINILIEKYNTINKVIIDNEDFIIEYIEKNNLQYLNHILITDLSENIILKFNKYDMNLYILNTSKTIAENNNLSYLSNIRSNIKILESNFIQYKYLNENLRNININNIIYFPILSNNNDLNIDISINDISINDNVINQILENNNMGFIISRNINCELSNNYWIESYQCIRKYYNNKIIIIDDNSDYNYVKNEITLVNCTIINSEFKKSGEILPYYYLYKYHFFNKAVILHDSVFINKYINFEKYNNVKFIWHFTHHWDNENEELELLNKLNNTNLTNFYHTKDKWYGCYGVQSFIEYKFLDILVKKYNIFSLIEYINKRELRMNFERIFGLICMYELDILSDCSMYGIIHHYIHWGYLYDNYIIDKKEAKLDDLDIIKVWSGR